MLVLFAVLLAPLTMMASHAASAAPMPAHTMDGASAMPGHCPPAGDDQDDRKTTSAIDCIILCSAIPAAAGSDLARVTFPVLPVAGPVEIGGHGRNPAADPPPPRRS